jgi:hypothetical protein
MATLTINSIEKEQRPRKQTRAEKLDEFLRAAKFKLQGWNQFTADMLVPAEFGAALITGRPELLRLVPPTALTAEQTKALYNLVATLIETNTELQQHAQMVAKVVSDWSEQFKGLSSLGWQIERFANFEQIGPAGEEDQ